MARERKKGWGTRANEATTRLTSQVDDQTGEASRKAASLIVLAVRILRIPTAILLVLPIPFLIAMGFASSAIGGTAGVLCGLLTLVLTAILTAFGWQRRQIIRAADDPEALGTELGIMVNLSDRADDTRGVLEQLAGGGGVRLFSRLTGAWRGVTMPARWIDEVGDLTRARQFAPPRVGFTVTVTIATLWVVPLSVVGAILLLIGALARSV
ncbi:MAG: hypothetical protein QM621_00310 [Aeromicrobium sp.]|uniref:hypothetical protein n=1 Tax=Aeromicrobium sp. TaxID=1871063 RepID=UPI0039E52909